MKAECDQYRSASLPQSRLPSPIPHIGALSVVEIDRPLVRPKARCSWGGIGEGGAVRSTQRSAIVHVPAAFT